jgi:hypothetical protein
MTGVMDMASIARNILSRAEDLRRHQRVKLALDGRYMLEDRREFPCQTIDMSPGGVALFAPVKPPIGERIVVYLDEIGRVEGGAARHLETGFALALNATSLKREKLADQLTWLANRHALGLPDDRRHERLAPRNPGSILVAQDGRECFIKLIDVSLSGAAMNVEIKPALGTFVTVGGAPARVMRHFEGGIAIEFIRAAPLRARRSGFNSSRAVAA